MRHDPYYQSPLSALASFIFGAIIAVLVIDAAAALLAPFMPIVLVSAVLLALASLWIRQRNRW